MKRVVCIFLFILAVSMLNALDNSEINDILIGSTWSSKFGFVTVTFKADGTCHYFDDNMGGIGEWNVPYSIKNGKILFTADGNTYRFSLIEPEESFEYRYCLTDGRETAELLWGMAYSLPEMTEREWNGYPAYTVAPVKMKVLANLKMRENPDIKSKRLCVAQFMGEDNINLLLKGEEVAVVGRTRTKSTIGKWENYWYLVRLPVSMYTKVTYYDPQVQSYDMNAPALPELVWCYGEFLE